MATEYQTTMILIDPQDRDPSYIEQAIDAFTALLEEWDLYVHEVEVES